MVNILKLHIAESLQYLTYVYTLYLYHPDAAKAKSHTALWLHAGATHVRMRLIAHTCCFSALANFP
jgi:hypothetical protein